MIYKSLVIFAIDDLFTDWSKAEIVADDPRLTGFSYLWDGLTEKMARRLVITYSNHQAVIDFFQSMGIVIDEADIVAEWPIKVGQPSDRHAIEERLEKVHFVPSARRLLVATSSSCLFPLAVGLPCEWIEVRPGESWPARC